jgi:hypothetical protein
VPEGRERKGQYLILNVALRSAPVFTKNDGLLVFAILTFLVIFVQSALLVCSQPGSSSRHSDKISLQSAFLFHSAASIEKPPPPSPPPNSMGTEMGIYIFSNSIRRAKLYCPSGGGNGGRAAISGFSP